MKGDGFLRASFLRVFSFLGALISACVPGGAVSVPFWNGF